MEWDTKDSIFWSPPVLSQSYWNLASFRHISVPLRSNSLLWNMSLHFKGHLWLTGKAWRLPALWWSFSPGHCLRTGLYMIQFREYWLRLPMCSAFRECCGKGEMKKVGGWVEVSPPSKDWSRETERNHLSARLWAKSLMSIIVFHLCNGIPRGFYYLHSWVNKSQCLRVRQFAQSHTTERQGWASNYLLSGSKALLSLLAHIPPNA